MELNKTRIIQIAVAVLLLVGIVAGVLLVQRQQILKSRAAVNATENSLSLVASPSGEDAALTVSPEEEFNIDLLLKTTSQVNLVSALLKFPQDLLEVKFINQSNADPYIIRRWLENPEESTPSGTINMLGAITAPGFINSAAQSGLVTKITFKAKAGTAGQTATVEFDTSSGVYKNTDGTEVAQLIKRPLEVRIISPCPAAQACPTACGQAATTVSSGQRLANGSCGTTPCPATAVCPTPTPTPTPTLSPSPTPSPTPTPTSSCTGQSIWDGARCRPISSQEGVVIVGLDVPITTRAQLDEIERSFVRSSFPNFPEELFNPNTRDKGKMIQDIRLANTRRIGNDFERTWEFILNTDAKARLDQEGTTIGTPTIPTLLRHVDAVNQIWHNSLPSINRKAVLKRIIIVNNNVLSDNRGGWHVRNDRSFSWWANDDMNGVRGFIPYDIDSRWGLTDGWATFMLDAVLYANTRYNGVLIDYAMLHELSHHLPVGDNYVYTPGRAGQGFFVPQPNGKRAHFTRYFFMSNDHLTNVSAPKLTAPSSYFINFYWQKNPKHVRVAQASPYDDQEIHPYGRFFFDNLTIKLANLQGAGVEGCEYLKEDLQTSVLTPSTDRLSANFNNNECTVILSRQHQESAFPGAYIGLRKGQAVFPIFISRNTIETLYWARGLNQTTVPNQFTFTLNATNRLRRALEFYETKLNAGSGDVRVAPSTLSMYSEVISPASLPRNAIFYGALDQINNHYLIEYNFDFSIKGAVALSGVDASVGANRFTAVSCPGKSFQQHSSLRVSHPGLGDASWDCGPGFSFEVDRDNINLTSTPQTFTITPPPGYRCAGYTLYGDKINESFSSCSLTVSLRPNPEDLFIWFFLERR